MSRPLLPPRPSAAPVSTTTTVVEMQPEISFPPVQFTGEAGPSILPAAMKDLIFITGKPGTGKTTFALTVENPNNVLFLDFESKGAGLASQLPGMNYFAPLEDCTRLSGDVAYSPRAPWDRTLQIIKAIPQGRFTTVVLDNCAWIQSAAADLVTQDPIPWGVSAAAVKTSSYGGVWPGVGRAIGSLLTIIRDKGVQVVVATFQPKTAWVNGAPSLTRLRVTQLGIWQERSVLTLALGESIAGNAPIPSALVLKEQLASLQFDPKTGQFSVVRRLPLQLPIATMAEVRKYLESPADLRNPAPGEFPDADALEMWKTTFSQQQLMRVMKMLELTAAASAATEDDTVETDS